MSASDKTLTLFNVDLSLFTFRDYREWKRLIRKLDGDQPGGWVNGGGSLDLSLVTSLLTTGEHCELKRLMLKIFEDPAYVAR